VGGGLVYVAGETVSQDFPVTSMVLHAGLADTFVAGLDWLGPVDATPPTSQVAALAASQASATFTVAWSGSDTGSGVRDYSIYVSIDGGAFTVWQSQTTATSASYAGQPGHMYAFYSIARDEGGNIEAAKSAAEASTRVADPNCAVSVSAGSRMIPASGGNLAVQVTSACAWTVVARDAWLGPAMSSHSGSGTLNLNVAANSGVSRLGVVAIGNQSLTFLQRSNVQRFQDVPVNAPYADYISLLHQFGITGGCSTSPPLYCPSETLTRGQMAMFVTRALNAAAGVPLTYNPAQYFQDVGPAHLFFGGVQRIKELGITAGCSVTPPLYCWDEQILQGQMAVFTIKSWQIATNTPTLSYPTQQLFTDVAPNHLFYAYIQKMKELGIWAGCGSNQYCWDAPVTREQAAVQIVRGFFGAP
jgi:hypothetical protein